MKKIKKFTEREASDFRDQFVMRVSTVANGISAEFAISQAYAMADTALMVREQNCEPVEMDCDCKEPKDGGSDHTTILLNPKLSKLNPKGKPPRWFLWVVAITIFLASNGIWYVIAKILGKA